MYEKPFWEEDRDMIGLLNDAAPRDSLNQKDYSSNRGRFYFFWNCIKTSGRPVLVALMAGDAAHAAETTDNATLIREATERLRKAFAPSPVPEPSEAIVTRWKKDQFARGVYSYMGPQAQPGDYDTMARPVGPLHFAGEATCATHPATVHGAYLSGLRAAAEVIESMLGPINIQAPLVPPKSKPEPNNGQGQKRKHEESLQQATREHGRPAKNEEYEASIIGAILGEIGERPIKPGRSGVNPFLLYQNDHWYECKATCDEMRRATTGDPNAKASRNDIRIHLGLMWRTASDEIKKPYLDRTQNAREVTAASVAKFKEDVATWDREAARIRKEYVEKNPLPDGSHKLFAGRTAIEAGSVRSNRKLNGYAEDSDPDM